MVYDTILHTKIQCLEYRGGIGFDNTFIVTKNLAMVNAELYLLTEDINKQLLYYINHLKSIHLGSADGAYENHCVPPYFIRCE